MKNPQTEFEYQGKKPTQLGCMPLLILPICLLAVVICQAQEKKSTINHLKIFTGVSTGCDSCTAIFKSTSSLSKRLFFEVNPVKPLMNVMYPDSNGVK